MMQPLTQIKRTLRRHVSPSLLIHAVALNNYYFGAREIRYIKRLCHPDLISIDVGANLGVYTYFMKRYSRDVHAYEPNPLLAEALRKTFPKNVEVHELALSNGSGMANLSIPTYGGVEMHGLASVAQSFREDTEAEAVRVISVALGRLDEQGHQRVGFVKIDVEQHEQEVLEGAAELIREQRPNLLVEVTPLLYRDPLPDVFASILQLGYSGYFLFEGSLTSLSDYNVDLHNASANFGNPERFVTDLMFVAKGLDL
jgi:FkbM family methyltransferase